MLNGDQEKAGQLSLQNLHALIVGADWTQQNGLSMILHLLQLLQK